MKKGKRQVLEKNFFQPEDNQQSESSSFALNTTKQSHFIAGSFFDSNFQPANKEPQSHSPSQPNRVANVSSAAVRRQQIEDTSISPISEESKATQVRHSNRNDISIKPSEDKDDKKSKIELLKQKYLKKTEAKSKVTEPILQQEPKQSLTQRKNQPQNNQLKKVQAETENYKKVEVAIGHQFEPATKDIQPEKESYIRYIQKQTPVKRQLTATDQQMKQEVVVEKKVQRGFKVPPPPPAKRGPKSPVPPAPVRAKEIVSDQPEPQEQDLRAQPPSNQTEKLSGASPPKRPGSRPNSVQQIIAKRLKKEDIVIPKEPENEIQERSQKKCHKQAQSQPLPARSMPLDQEYIDRPLEALEEANKGHLTRQQYEFDFREAIRIWYSDSDHFFTKLLPRDSALLTILNNSPTSQLLLTSKNPAFNPLIGKMLMEFVFRGSYELTEGQKDVINDLALQFFYSNPNVLANQFLLVIVKLGPKYLTKYSQFFTQHLHSYSLTILKYKDYFLPQELTNYVDFILSGPIAAQEVLHLLILLQPTDQLTSFIFSSNLQDQKTIVLSLGACHQLSKQNKNVLGIYFKLISLLIDTIARDTSLLEGVLKYINQIEPHQKYYPLQKQLKLKLINIISNSVARHEPSQHKEKEIKEEGGKGFMGIWNKALDKFKTATTQLTDKPKASQPQPQENQAPQDDITYDPVLKRYLINGKVPEDDGGAAGNPSNGPKPPPPPPKSNRPVAPPPPAGIKKGRTVTATNRYA